MLTRTSQGLRTYVRATRTSLLLAARTRGAGQLSLVRAVRTAHLSTYRLRQTTTLVVRGLGRAFLCLSVCLSTLVPLTVTPQASSSLGWSVCTGGFRWPPDQREDVAVRHGAPRELPRRHSTKQHPASQVGRVREHLPAASSPNPNPNSNSNPYPNSSPRPSSRPSHSPNPNQVREAASRERREFGMSLTRTATQFGTPSGRPSLAQPLTGSELALAAAATVRRRPSSAAAESSALLSALLSAELRRVLVHAAPPKMCAALVRVRVGVRVRVRVRVMVMVMVRARVGIRARVGLRVGLGSATGYASRARRG